MKILALEFSSSQRSVAVVQALGNRRFAMGKPQASVSSEVIQTGAQSTSLIGMIEEALRQTGLEREQIECIAIGLGPGSYTGIRTAIALAQGWQLGGEVKLIGISSAECLAAEAQAEGIGGPVDVMIDAQRNEFYIATFDICSETPQEIVPLRLATLAEVQQRHQSGVVLIGPEVTKWFPDGRLLFPRAGTTGQLALARSDFVVGEKLEPIYLREPTFVKAAPPGFPRPG